MLVAKRILLLDHRRRPVLRLLLRGHPRLLHVRLVMERRCTRTATAFLLALTCSSTLFAQETRSAPGRIQVYGDTSNGPPSCRAGDAIAALRDWFAALFTGDSAKVMAAVAPNFEWISVTSFVGVDSAFVGRDFAQLVAYARRRAKVHE